MGWRWWGGGGGVAVVGWRWRGGRSFVEYICIWRRHEESNNSTYLKLNIMLVQHLVSSFLKMERVFEIPFYWKFRENGKSY